MSEQLLASAQRKYGLAEVYRVESESQPVSFEADKLKELSTRETSGVALRVIRNGRIGFTSTTNPDDEAGLVDVAGDLAELGSPVAFEFPGGGSYPQVTVFDPEVERITQGRMVETGRQLIGGLKEKWPDLLCEARIGASTGRMEIRNSSGLSHAYRQSGYYVFLGGKLIRGTDMLLLWEGHSSSRVFGSEDLDRIQATLLQQLEYCREIVPAPSGEVPVIFTPRGVGSALLGPLMEGFNGKNIANGSSPLVGKEGHSLVDTRISVFDDPTMPGASGSRPCDDEGVPSRRISLIESGVVHEAYFDLLSAARAGRKSTGSAHRSLATPPAPGTSVIDWAGGTSTKAKMFADIEDGIVVEDLLGAGQGNELGGDFRANVSLGYRIQGGQIIGRIKNTMISGNVWKVLSQVRDVSLEQEWVGGHLHAPYISLRGVEIAAKG